MSRVIVYVDGFNLYRGMREARMSSLLWLDLWRLGEELCPAGASVEAVKYVTARILNLKKPSDPKYPEEEASRDRQTEYIDALKSRNVQVLEGKFKRRTIKCRTCNTSWPKPEEKASDVHLATQLLCDGFRGNFDTAMIVSGDADIAPAARVVVGELKLPVVIAFPPKRVLTELKTVGSSFLHINRRHIAKSQLPDTFIHDGHTFKRPAEWS